MLTTSFPRWRGDQNGSFVRDLVDCLLAGGQTQIRVSCLADPNAPVRESLSNLVIHRLRYFWPATFQRLGYGPGIPWNIRSSWIAKINVPFLILAFLSVLVFRARRFDIIHAHWGVLGALAVATRWIHGKPIVLTVHGSDLRTSNRLIRASTCYAIRRADAVLTPSPEFHRWCLDIRGRGHLCLFVPNGTRMPPMEELQSTQEAREAAGEPLKIVSAARIVDERRYDLLIRALGELRKELPELRLTLVGDGPALPALRELARELGLQDIVEFTGQVAPSEVPAYLRNADLYASPTTIENFGTAVVEAAAHALPVVTTRVGFPGELVLNGHTGRIIPPNDQAALTEAIRGILLSPTRRQMGLAMRQRAEELELGLMECSQRVLDVYCQCLREKHPSRAEDSVHSGSIK